MCALAKDKAAEFFQPQRLGMACRAGTEKVAHALRECIEEHWMDEDFVVLNVDMRSAFNMVSRQLSLMCVLHFSLSCYLGCLGAMGPILCYGTLLAGSAPCQECSKVTL